MKPITRLDLERQLKANQINPLYLLVGSESYLRDQSAQAITDAALAGTLLREFNESTFSLLSDSASEALAAADQLPMMSSRRVIRIKHFAKLREADDELLIRYVNNPAPSTVAIFITDDLHKGRKLSKTLLDKCVVVEFPPFKDGEAKAWAKSRLKTLKIAIDEHTLSQIVALTGTDIQTLNSELDKLASAAAETKLIDSEMVDSLIGHSRTLSNFDLGDQLVARDLDRALHTLHHLLEDDVPEVMLLGLMAGNYHRLAVAKELLQQGRSDEVSRMVPYFKKDQFLAALRRSSREQLAEGLCKIAAADVGIKTSQATPRLQLEMLVCALAN
jgi:DNA polymerase-3 subunit delta